MKPLLIFLLAFSAAKCFAQPVQDSSLNNLAHAPGYVTCKTGQLGAVVKAGNGKQAMILVAGLGFGAEIFENFMRANKERYTMYAVTPAGFAGTPAPPMPDSAAYAACSWTKGIEAGILELIEKEKLQRPLIVGHFITSTQVALDLALHHPEKIGKVIIIGGEPYRYYRPRRDTAWGNEQLYTPGERAKIVEQFWAPLWFKTVTKRTWDAGMYRPEEYVADSATGKKLFAQSASAPLPVMIRYLLEFFAYDISSRYSEIKVPVLVLMPSFSEELLNRKLYFSGQAYSGDYLYYYYQRGWDSARKAGNPLLQFQLIPGTRILMWYDAPEGVQEAIDDFAGK